MARERSEIETSLEAKPKADIFLALLIVTTVATALASLLMWMEMSAGK